MSPVGAPKAMLPELPRQSERLSFLYLEYCRVSRDDSGIIAETDKAVTEIPIATLSVLLLGPGTSITHRAVEMIGDSGTSVCWVGQDGLKLYAFGSPLTKTSRMADKQASLVSNRRKRLAVARKMYQMRFPGENVSRLTMQQLRGREGSRIRKAYAEQSKTWGVEWNGRSYKVDNYGSGDLVNASLSIANSCLYGVAHSVICSLGCHPALGFVHVGHQKSFVYDVADLYKTETSIPVSFKIASERPANVWRSTRTEMRTVMKETHIVERMVKDIQYLLETDEDDDPCTDSVLLWDEKNDIVESGRSY